MNDKINEALSSLVDDEHPDGDTPDAVVMLIGDAAAKAKWARYHLIGEAIRGNLHHAPQSDLVSPLRAKIEAEPEPVVVHLSNHGKRRFLRPLTGLALAASVATVAIIGVRSIERPVSSSSEIVAEVQQPSVELPVAVFTSANRWNVEQRSVEDRLNGYLVDHSEYAGYGVQGMLPYARIVGYDTSQP